MGVCLALASVSVFVCDLSETRQSGDGLITFHSTHPPPPSPSPSSLPPSLLITSRQSRVRATAQRRSFLLFLPICLSPIFIVSLLVLPPPYFAPMCLCLSVFHLLSFLTLKPFPPTLFFSSTLFPTFHCLHRLLLILVFSPYWCLSPPPPPPLAILSVVSGNTDGNTAVPYLPLCGLIHTAHYLSPSGIQLNCYLSIRSQGHPSGLTLFLSLSLRSPMHLHLLVSAGLTNYVCTREMGASCGFVCVCVRARTSHRMPYCALTAVTA